MTNKFTFVTNNLKKSAEKHIAKNLKRVIREKLNEQVLEITPLKGGMVSIVYKVKCKRKSYVIKYVKEKKFYLGEVFGLTTLNTLNIHAPNIFYHKPANSKLLYHITEYLPLKTFEDTQNEKGKLDKKDIYTLGNLLQAFHNKSTVYANKLPKQLKEYYTNYNFYNFHINKDLKVYYIKNKIFSKAEIRSFCNNVSKEKFDSINTVVHGDFNNANVLKGAKTCYLFDCNSKPESKYYDLAFYYYTNNAFSKYNYTHDLFKAYKNVNLKKVKHYNAVMMFHRLKPWIEHDIKPGVKWAKKSIKEYV